MIDSKQIENFMNMCKNKKIKISCAESITGGLIAASLISIEGASEVIEESYITYSDKVKNKVLGVKEEILHEFSAVSKEVVKEMLLGLERKTDSNLLIASSGYAGPSGYDVGKVFLGILYQGEFKILQEKFTGNRNEIREKAVNRAVELASYMLNN